ncbi:MAG: hypothetical protein AAFX41_00920, partial [Bacteroidota bacterium]
MAVVEDPVERVRVEPVVLAEAVQGPPVQGDGPLAIKAAEPPVLGRDPSEITMSLIEPIVV